MNKEGNSFLSLIVLSAVVVVCTIACGTQTTIVETVVVEREVPVELLVEVPVEVEVTREVEVEIEREVQVAVTREVYVTREVPVEVERVVEVPVEVERIVEVPIEVPIEITREVFVEVAIEVPIEVTREVPVELVIEVPVEVAVEVEKPVEAPFTHPSGLRITSVHSADSAESPCDFEWSDTYDKSDGGNFFAVFYYEDFDHDRIARLQGRIYIMTGADVVQEFPFELKRTITAPGQSWCRWNHINTQALQPGSYTIFVTVTDLIGGVAATGSHEFTVRR